MTLLELEAVHTYYGGSHVLQGVSFGVDRASITCLVGRNGAGKTTTVRSIMGFTPPRGGRIVFQGQ